MGSFIVSGLMATLLASTALGVPVKKRQDSPIPPDGDFTFACSNQGATSNDGFTIILPGDGSATEAGFDQPGNCGFGVLDNLHGQGLIVNDYACNYVGTSTAEIQFKLAALTGTLQVTRALEAATGTQLSDDFCDSTTPIDVGSSAPPPAPSSAPSSKRDVAGKRKGPTKRNALPSDGDITFSCQFDEETVPPIDQYVVILPGDGTTTVAGFDQPGNCGQGVLDNMNGQALAVSDFGCNYVGSNTANITFNLSQGLSSEVAAAINAATGSQEAVCSESSDPGEGDPPDPAEPEDGPEGDPPAVPVGGDDPDPDPAPPRHK